MESSKETGCQAPEGPILCINNCGFFGSATTMNMCSKCHRDIIVKQENAKLVENIVNGSVDSKVADIISTATNIIPKSITTVTAGSPSGSTSVTFEPKLKEGPSRCNTCRKRVGLTGFECRCGNLYCSSHRYSDKHDCQFDYQSAGRDAIAKANPIVRGNKLDKI